MLISLTGYPGIKPECTLEGGLFRLERPQGCYPSGLYYFTEIISDGENCFFGRNLGVKWESRDGSKAPG